MLIRGAAGRCDLHCLRQLGRRCAANKPDCAWTWHTLFIQFAADLIIRSAGR